MGQQVSSSSETLLKAELRSASELRGPESLSLLGGELSAELGSVGCGISGCARRVASDGRRDVSAAGSESRMYMYMYMYM